MKKTSLANLELSWKIQDEEDKEFFKNVSLNFEVETSATVYQMYEYWEIFMKALGYNSINDFKLVKIEDSLAYLKNHDGTIS